MPAKFKESTGLYRNRKKVGMQHFYMHTTSTEELMSAYERIQNLSTRISSRTNL